MSRFESMLWALQDASDGCHEGLVDLLNQPVRDVGMGAQLANMSTCALAIRAAAWLAGVESSVFDTPYRPGSAMSDLWKMFGVPWGRSMDATRAAWSNGGVLLVGRGGQAHVALVRIEFGVLRGYEAGQIDSAGRQIVRPVRYVLHDDDTVVVRSRDGKRREVIGCVEVRDA